MSRPIMASRRRSAGELAEIVVLLSDNPPETTKPGPLGGPGFAGTGLEGQDLGEDLGQVEQVRLTKADALVVLVTGVAGVEDVVVAGAGGVDVGEDVVDAVGNGTVHDRVPEADPVTHVRVDDRVGAVQLRVDEAGAAELRQPADRGAVDQVTGLRVAV